VLYQRNIINSTLKYLSFNDNKWLYYEIAGIRLKETPCSPVPSPPWTWHCAYSDNGIPLSPSRPVGEREAEELHFDAQNVHFLAVLYRCVNR
jgi:hypothetical protein